MTRLLTLTLAVLLFAPGLVRAETALDGSFNYTPPAVPAAPDPINLLLRLVGLTAALLVFCIVVFIFAKRTNRIAGVATQTNGRMRHEGTLKLDRRSAVHLVWVEGQTVAVTTDASGVRSIVVLSEPFERALEEAEKRDAA